ncbi:MAG: acylphosphatase [Candidatus Latescibacteria bacterium]|nr:acylphosphatase [Candidatus Latescibacterota bacterium]
MPERARVHILVSGVVQGVGFRFFTRRIALGYGMTGYVRNLPDGRVEIAAEGDRSLLIAFCDEVRRGPRWSHVTGMQVEWKEPKGEFGEFTIL